MLRVIPRVWPTSSTRATPDLVFRPRALTRERNPTDAAYDIDPTKAAQRLRNKEQGTLRKPYQERRAVIDSSKTAVPINKTRRVRGHGSLRCRYRGSTVGNYNKRCVLQQGKIDTRHILSHVRQIDHDLLVII